MDLMLQKYLELRNSEEGQTMAEYGLLLALIAVVVMVAVLALGPRSRPCSKTSQATRGAEFLIGTHRR